MDGYENDPTKEILLVPEREITYEHKFEEEEDNDHHGDDGFVHCPYSIVFLVIDKCEVVLLYPIVGDEVDTSEYSLNGAGSRKEEPHSEHHKALGLSMAQIERYVINEGSRLQGEPLALFVKARLEPSHEPMPNIKQKHGIREKGCLNRVAQKYEAIVDKILSQSLWPTLDGLLSQIDYEGEYGGLNC